MIAGFLWALLALVAVLAAVAVTPVHLRCVVSGEPRWRAIVVARLLAGLTPPIRVFDSARRREKRARKRAAPKPRAPRFRNVSHIVDAVPALLADILGRVRFRRLAIDADVGLGDPADTGQVFGVVQAARYAIPSPSRVSVELRPDFERVRLAGRLSADASFIPAAFIPPAIRFAWRSFGPRR
jgi:hypothetical protein